MSFKYMVEKISDNHYVLPKTKDMKTDIHAFLSEKLYNMSEEEMWNQAVTAASNEGVTGFYLQPDCHLGFGIPIGGVVVTDDVIIQAGSGYDISCGIILLKMPLKADSLISKKVRRSLINEIEKRIATGLGANQPELMKKYSNKKLEEFLRYGAKPLGVKADMCERQYIEVDNDADFRKIEKAFNRAAPQLGSVGSGNHYVEIQVDKDSGDVYVQVHCGSRAYGWQTANHFFFEGAELRGLPKNRREQSWLRIDEPLGKEYWNYHNSAANYAIANRHIIVEGVNNAFEEVLKVRGELFYEISHNLVQEETLVLPDGSTKKGFVHRKGATRAFPAGHPDLVGTKWEKTGHPVLIPGCLGAGTRILMASGFYKNIEEIKTGDIVINGSGNPAKVKALFKKGKKKTISYRSSRFWNKTYVTPDHYHLIGDLSTFNWKREGRLTALKYNHSDGSSKFKWSKIPKTSDDFVLLLPKKIKFNLSDKAIDICNKKIKPSYEIGYILGFFIGDGCSWFKLKRNGQTNFYLSKNQKKEIEKLYLYIEKYFKTPAVYNPPQQQITIVTIHDMETAKFFDAFGKKTNKHLPENLLRSDKEYLKGLYDGLIDSDGHLHAKTKKFTNTSYRAIEIFGIIHYLLFNYFPSVSVRPPSAGGLKNCNIKNCNTSYRGTSLKYPLVVKEYQLVYPIGLVPTARGKDRKMFIKNNKTKTVETYDLSIEGKDPSFIANNVIVHNSMFDGAAILYPQDSQKSGYSVNHGSGRIKPRGQAKREFAVLQQDINDEMNNVKRTLGGIEIEGILTNTRDVDLTECKHVYKELDDVLGVLEAENIAKISNRLYPVANLKGTD